VKLTDSPKAPWRFDPAKLGLSAEEKPSLPVALPRRRPPARSGTGQLLKVRR